MWTIFISILSLISYTNGQGASFGPYSYPTGDLDLDGNTFITFGEFNASHFYLNMNIEGDMWMGFAFADSHYPDGCKPTSGCSVTVGDSGCTGVADTGCRMVGTDAIIFGNYGGTVDLAVKEWTLGNHSMGTMHASQDLGAYTALQSGSTLRYSATIRRPYNPSNYGDRWSYQ